MFVVAVVEERSGREVEESRFGGKEVVGLEPEKERMEERYRRKTRQVRTAAS